MARLVSFKMGSKLPLRIALLTIFGVVVFSVLSFSFSFFNKKASFRDQATSEDELNLYKRDHVADEEEDLKFHWDYDYTSIPPRTNPCSYFNPLDPDNTFFCVPHFLVLGCQCSGQDVLFKMLQLHENISYQRPTGLNYFTENDNFEAFSVEDMEDYAKRFNNAAQEIKDNGNLVVGDTGCYLIRNFIVSESEHQDQPKKIAPLFLSHLNQNMKLFFTVRNPVDRFYCCWCKSNDKRGVDQVAALAMDNFRKCEYNYPTRKCAYIWDNLIGAESCIAGGLSIIFFEDLLMYFPRSQIEIVHWKDMVTGDPFEQMDAYSDFLGIGSPGPEFLLAMATLQSGGGGCQREPMSMVTRQKLHAFYEPFDTQMSIKLGNDPRFIYPTPR